MSRDDNAVFVEHDRDTEAKVTDRRGDRLNRRRIVARIVCVWFYFRYGNLLDLHSSNLQGMLFMNIDY